MLYNILSFYLDCPSGCGDPHEDWACCKGECPCALGEGDCDDDSECVGDLICHQNLENCGADFPVGFDCCTQPPSSAGYAPDFVRMLDRGTRNDNRRPRPQMFMPSTRGEEPNIWLGTYLYRRIWPRQGRQDEL